MRLPSPDAALGRLTRLLIASCLLASVSGCVLLKAQSQRAKPKPQEFSCGEDYPAVPRR
jgi:hypothetical protein